MFGEFLEWRHGDADKVSALFVGGGGYTFPRYMEKRYPRAEIAVVEIDPVVSEVAYEDLGVPRDSKIRSYNDDARWFIMNQKETGRYDMIFLDAFNDLSIPYHLTTKEYAMSLKSLLKEDGIILANLIDDVEKGLLLPSYIATLEEVFGKGRVNLIVPAADGSKVGVTTCLVAVSPTSLDLDDFTRKIGALKGGKMDSRVISQAALQQGLAGRPAIVLTDDFVPVDNLIAPLFEQRFGYRKQ
jgi:spermidine synthase